MGAATVMMTSGERLPSNVRVVIEDCGYTSAWEEFAYELKTCLLYTSYKAEYRIEVIDQVMHQGDDRVLAILVAKKLD